MRVIIEGKSYDTNLLDLYEIPYRYENGRLGVQNGKHFYTIKSRQAQAVVKRMTMNMPELIEYQRPAFLAGIEQFRQSNKAILRPVSSRYANRGLSYLKIGEKKPPKEETMVRNVIPQRATTTKGNQVSVSSIKAADLYADVQRFLHAHNNNGSVKILVSRSDDNVTTFEGIRAGQSIFTKDSPLHEYYALIRLITSFLHVRQDYLNPAPLSIQLLYIPDENAKMVGFKDGIYNCACAPVIAHLERLADPRCVNVIKRVKKLSDKYLKDGIDDEGLQLLATTARVELVCMDASRAVWKTFKSINKATKIILYAHNKHFTHVLASDVGSINIIKIKDQHVEWHPPNFDFTFLNKLHYNGCIIESKGRQVALITEEIIYKTTFHESDKYPNAYTDGGVAKAKFIEMCPQLKYGTSYTDPFFSIQTAAIQSGFYSQRIDSNPYNIKFDHNKSYPSFKQSGIFNGFPNIEAVFKVNKYVSELIKEDKSILFMHGMVYIEYPQVSDLSQPIYYEGSGWKPIEIVRSYYENYNIDPLIRSFAYASTTFDCDFTTMTHQQQRAFFGKCHPRDSTNSWRTNDTFEYLRGLYELRDKIDGVRITNLPPLDYYRKDATKLYEIIYRSDKKSWCVPIIPAYVHAHQKFVLFKHYNALVKLGVPPVSVRVDSIEIELNKYNENKEAIAHIFDIGANPGQWKYEKVITNSAIGADFDYLPREEIEYDHDSNLEYDPLLILPKLCHFSGSGGNGKTNQLLKIKKAYPNACVMAPTHEACDVIQKRAIEDGNPFKVHTYHSIFGIGCRSDIPDNCKLYICDEGSMISTIHLRQINMTLQKHLGNTELFGGATIVLLGDFWQLPPISPMISLYNNWTGVKDPLYAQFTEIELTINFRQQNDPTFYNDCQTLRNVLTKDEAMAAIDRLNTRVVEELPSYNTLDDMYIAGTNEQIDAVNSKCDKNNLTGVKVITIKAVMINRLHGGTSHQTKAEVQARQYHKQTLSKGQILLVTKHDITGLYATQNGVEYFFKEYDDNVLKIAMALTVHKSQGKTLKGNVIIDPSRLFERNQLYVAITRATKFDNIYLTCPITFAQFCKTVRVV